MGMGGKRLAPAILPLGKGLITLLQEAVWAPVSLCGPQCHCVGPSVTVWAPVSLCGPQCHCGRVWKISPCNKSL